MVNVYFFGKQYSVPAELTIMTAMEYAGYKLVRGCGCRHGFCGACATIYRIKGNNELKTCLACQTQVQEGMYVATLPFFPTDKRNYDINEVEAKQKIMMELYPEIYSCIGCNACTKGCPQSLSVMQYIYDHIMYAELNTKSDYCQCCGYNGEIQVVDNGEGKLVWRCPNCGNENQDKMNVARRTCGYIGTQFWNQGRTQEIKERVLHL